MKYTHLLWDFNGTLLSDMETGIISVNKMLRERGLDEIESLDMYKEIFDFPIQDYYRSLGFDFEKEPYSVLAPIWVELYIKNSDHSKLSPGVLAVLSSVASLGIRQSIISASETDMLKGQLAELGIISYFDEIVGLDNIHAESKLHLAESWRENNLDARVLYVGDTLHDAETAKQLRADCLLYSGGHQSRRKLESSGCTVIDSLEEILNYIK